MLKKWANGQLLTKEEKEAVSLLRKAGCKCRLPLLGHVMENGKSVGPRCRLCNAEIAQLVEQ